MTNIQFFIFGEPAPCPKKLISSRGGKIRMYERTKTKSGRPTTWIAWKAAIELAVSKEMHDKKPIPQGIPIRLTMIFVRTRPKGDKSLYPTTKPDCSNYYYGVENLLKGHCFFDDNQVVGIQSGKIWQDGKGVSVNERYLDNVRSGCHVLIEVLHETNRREK